MFQFLYQKVKNLASHTKAIQFLALIGFLEASIFPIPPDFLLGPMCLTKPKNSLYYAWVTTLSSIIGGLLGYFIGFMLYEPVVLPLVHWMSWKDKLALVHSLYTKWGVWAVLISGFTPIPYKLFTIASGLMHFPISTFIFASIISRGARFYLVAGLLHWQGKKIRDWLDIHMQKVGWIILMLILIILIVNNIIN